MGAAPPRPGWFVLVCAALVAVPTALVLAGSLGMLGILAFSSPRDEMSGFALCGLIGFPLPAAGALVLEYRAVVRRNATAAQAVGAVGLYFTLMGFFGWLAELVGLPGSHDRPNGAGGWADFAIFTALVLLLGLVSVGHLAWATRLNRAKQAAPVDDLS